MSTLTPPSGRTLRRITRRLQALQPVPSLLKTVLVQYASDSNGAVEDMVSNVTRVAWRSEDRGKTGEVGD